MIFTTPNGFRSPKSAASTSISQNVMELCPWMFHKSFWNFFNSDSMHFLWIGCLRTLHGQRNTVFDLLADDHMDQKFQRRRILIIVGASRVCAYSYDRIVAWKTTLDWMMGKNSTLCAIKYYLKIEVFSVLIVNNKHPSFLHVFCFLAPVVIKFQISSITKGMLNIFYLHVSRRNWSHWITVFLQHPQDLPYF